jgi:hypothetical protein
MMCVSCTYVNCDRSRHEAKAMSSRKFMIILSAPIGILRSDVKGENQELGLDGVGE